MPVKAIIVSAGQGRRLLPLTEDMPKCLLPVVDGRALLEVQLRALAACGVEQVTVVVGFRADKVEDYIADHGIPGLVVETLFNPFYEVADNLATIWLATRSVSEDFIVLNGDTLFEEAALRRLLASPVAPITVTINEKHGYDDDDMKVSIDGSRRLLAIGKTLDAEIVNGESIGMLLFRGEGVQIFRDTLDAAMRTPEGLKAWYLQVINTIAQSHPVETTTITGLWWGEVDSPEDLAEVRASLAKRIERAPQQPSLAVA
ncbi:MAG: phosphocholine cytidylyltransferase family protein [Deltaproteobacteria bacterium]|nr:phosphocholine cytidylyltransferase family protein [Deltaproteobacteria bacterium]MBW2417207.1 phosphocholine cytidylyltransferase family protein [Deltaproteobacteria bacterium]